jgi:acetyltransferase
METTNVPTFRLAGGAKVVIRAVRSGDGPLLQAFVHRLSARSRYLRFFSALSGLSPAQLDRFLNLDPRRGIALVALSEGQGGTVIVAEARCVLETESSNAEFAIAVADEFHRQGLGMQLVRRLLTYASRAGVRRVFGEIMTDNHGMLAFVRRLGFQLRTKISDGTVLIASIAPR